jgi:RNA polymerase sigma factor (TIGR02999 family)
MQREASGGDELIVVVYDALRDLAENYLRRERADHTLQPTALVHEAYLRLAEQGGIRWQSREHFMGIAATMMRRVLVNHAVSHKREKRGGGRKVSLAGLEGVTGAGEVGVAELDEALVRLTRHHPQESRVVELRFFGGLTIAETARALDLSDSTVERAWNFARAWLRRELGRGE